MNVIKLPELGEDIRNAKVVFFHAKEGEKIEFDQDLLEVSTDKATFIVPAPCAGIVKKFIVDIDSEVNIGDPLVQIQEAN